MFTSNDQIRDATINYLGSIGIDVAYQRFTNDNIMLRCPFAKVGGHTHTIDSNPSFGIKVTRNGFTFNCFTCGRKGRSLIALVNMMNAEGVSDVNVQSVYDLQNSLQVQFPKWDETFILNPREEVKHDALKNFKKKSLPMFKYNLKRGIRRSIGETFELHYDFENSKIIFPVFNYDNKLVGTVEHSIIGELPKYKNSDFDSGSYLYPEWLIKGGIGIVVEGMYDTIKVYQHLKDWDMLRDYSVVNTFGSKVSAKQKRKLVKYFDRLILMGDNDMAGIKMERDIYDSIRKKLPLIFKANYRGSDPAEIGKQKFKIYLDQIVPFRSLVR